MKPLSSVLPSGLPKLVLSGLMPVSRFRPDDGQKGTERSILIKNVKDSQLLFRFLLIKDRALLLCFKCKVTGICFIIMSCGCG